MSGATDLVPAIEAGGPVVFVGMHFGAVELPAYYAGQVAGRPATGPMETVGDPEIARWYLETRGAMGVRLVGLREARRELLAAAKAGGVLAIVADRDITGGGIPTPFFGHPAPLPVGAALVALETGAPILAIAVRRTGIGRYAARVEEVAIPSDGTRRERVEAILAGEARKFESFIVDAPAQWWGAFYPIWPDLEDDR
jgi:KDO2-lipid IV(A) lauroyltransferase